MPHRWALGRFVLPAARLDEFLKAREEGDIGPLAAQWQQFQPRLSRIWRRSRNLIARHCGAVIDCVEVRVRNLDEIELVRVHRPSGVSAFFEISPEQAEELLPALRRIGGCAKLRAGGVVEEAFPAVEQIAGFIARCAELGVPFKATAGLHHPLRCIRPLTYEPHSREAPMHGFLNLFTAAADRVERGRLWRWSSVRRTRHLPCRRRARKLALWRRRADLEWRRRANPARVWRRSARCDPDLR